MNVNNEPYQSIWYNDKKDQVWVIDQRKLPFEFTVIELKSVEDAFWAIKEMVVRGAPLIGVTAAYGMYLAIKKQGLQVSEAFIQQTADYLKSSRPTAINLAYEVDLMVTNLINNFGNEIKTALEHAVKVEKREIENCSRIGEFGLDLILKAAKQKSNGPLNILTHCNAGWLACVDWGTALAPIYKSHEKGIPIHIWVDETRPRNQGARLTAWELESAGIPYTVIADNTGGHLMQHNMVDMVIVGSDRTTINGDVANKIGTYLKALAASDNDIPFYVALPSSSIDFKMEDGIKNIPIEQRTGEELTKMECLVDNEIKEVHLMPENTNAANYGFDVTPARLVSLLITERGVCSASKDSILGLFPEYK